MSTPANPDPKDVQVRLALIEAKLRDMQPKLDAVHDKIISVQWCPEPTLCLALRTVTTDHEARLRFLERSTWKLAGASSVLTGAVMLAAQFLIRHYSPTP